ncbi:MAG TPA: methylated-DNA--[protein]-cysteine S-methyltransferase [Lysobacter sp.]|jgi:AraC family transcriptional regulator of adaptative response/methylated-DNA-[protein]-cysteine methyltransferase|nr:methylated-DNA--[protein]-cysteine S-methyltransferase [Lysobacter sp.]
MNATQRKHAAFTTEHDPRWAEVVARDASADGRFRYSVSTTGVYCKPSCAARQARPEHVRFHATPQDAERAGFRACKRCKPDQARASPTDQREGRTRAPIRFAVGVCALGLLLVARSERGVCAILPGVNADALVQDLRARFPLAELIVGDSETECLLTKIAAFIAAPRDRLAVALDAQGSEFQQRVWHALCAVPLGTTVSYKEVARRVGSPRAVRAVAAACAANPLAVAIPCHRVLCSDGGLSGYRWGIARKRALLAQEAQG